MSHSGVEYKIVICGGGLAGLTLSLQLKRDYPEVSITVIEKTTRPLPEAAHKVGESTVEIGAHYLSSVLGLKNYLEEKHPQWIRLYHNFYKSFHQNPLGWEARGLAPIRRELIRKDTDNVTPGRGPPGTRLGATTQC